MATHAQSGASCSLSTSPRSGREGGQRKTEAYLLSLRKIPSSRRRGLPTGPQSKASLLRVSTFFLVCALHCVSSLPGALSSASNSPVSSDNEVPDPQRNRDSSKPSSSDATPDKTHDKQRPRNRYEDVEDCCKGQKKRAADDASAAREADGKEESCCDKKGAAGGSGGEGPSSEGKQSCCKKKKAVAAEGTAHVAAEGHKSSCCGVMPMSFQNSLHTVILFHSWETLERWQYVLSLLTCVVLGMLSVVLKVLRLRLEFFLAKRDRAAEDAQRVEKLKEKEGQSSAASPSSAIVERLCGNFPLKQNSWRMLEAFVIYGYDYLLMLIVMTYNVGLFFAVTGGLALGFFCFGHLLRIQAEKEENSLEEDYRGDPCCCGT
ncbi:Ctr copper transporter family protein [Toxoplasma gondii ME49]|uniref:Copper transport protein n=1 Tax=Toxoplasma gondii (strain ATCC 50611 / Me49) TaxID=508771 RepID=S8F7Y6_TOXGM|nr:Ctr copper transporter family protein [Toxoplasma gondii ME49]EPT29663.1 Ctr copper transporter family protein [Toxoplasma gondii ME49]|eukprot:XP_002365371.1 Ctr copper transporter family protein [Toxoplasma gondii ME49]